MVKFFESELQEQRVREKAEQIRVEEHKVAKGNKAQDWEGIQAKEGISNIRRRWLAILIGLEQIVGRLRFRWGRTQRQSDGETELLFCGIGYWWWRGRNETREEMMGSWIVDWFSVSEYQLFGFVKILMSDLKLVWFIIRKVILTNLLL